MATASEIALSILIGAKLQGNFNNAIKGAQTGMQAIAKTSGTAVKAFGSVSVAAASTAVAAGAYLLKLGSDFDSAADSIRIGTGATGDALDALLNDFDSVYSNVPTTMENAGKAIADYNTRLGLTGPVLQSMSTQAIQVSDMLGEDLGSVIKESSAAIQIWNIDAENMSNAMDYVFKASQSTGVAFSSLMSNVQQFAPQLQELGYGFNESVAMIGQMEKAGVNTTEVLAAMKKSVTSLAQDGLDAGKGMELYTEKIKSAKTMTEATAIASEIFGTRAASTMASAIRDGAIDVAGLTKALSENKETITGCAEDTYDFAERLQMFKNSAEVALKPFANSVFDSMNELMPVASELLNGMMPQIENFASIIAPIMGDLIQETMPILVSTLDEIMPVLSDLMPLGADIISLFADGFKELLPYLPQILAPMTQMGKSVLPIILKSMLEIMPSITALIPVIIQLVNAMMPIITDVITVLIPPVTTIITSLLPVLMQIIQALIPLINVLNPIIYMLANAFGESLVQGLQMIMPIIQNIMGVFQGLIDFITGVFTGNWQQAWEGVKGVFSNTFGALGNIIKLPINAVIGIINSAIAGINSIAIDVPDWVPGLGGQTYGFNISQIPMLENGGIVTSPTLSMVGEGSEPEAVIPLSKLSNMLNSATYTYSTVSVADNYAAAGNAVTLAQLESMLTTVTFSTVSVEHSGGISENVNTLSQLENMLSSVLQHKGNEQKIVYSPTYHITGNVNRKDIEDAQDADFERFKQFMKKYNKEKQRVSF